MSRQNLVSPVEDAISIVTGGKRVTKQAIPMMISFSMSFILLATSMISGRHNSDSDHLAATALITSLANAESAFTFGPLFSIGILNSTAFGEYEAITSGDKKHSSNSQEIEQKRRTINDHNKNGTLVAMLVAAVPTVTLYYSEDILTVVFKQNDNVSSIAQRYLRVFSAAMYGWGWRVVNEQIMFSCRKPNFTAIIGIINFLLTLALSIAFCFPLDMGLRGIAWAFVIEAYLTPIMNTLYLMFHHDLRHFKFFREWRLDRKNDFKQIKNILTTAFPLFLSFFNEFGAQTAVSLLMGVLGSDELAAQNFMSQLFYFIFIAQISFANAASQEFGRALGAKLYHNANRYAVGGLISEVGLILPFLIAVSSYPAMMIWMGTGNHLDNGERWFHIVHELAPISATGILLDAVGFNFLQVLRQSGQNMYPSLFSILCLWAGVGLGYGLGFGVGWGARGVAAGYSLGLLTRALGLGARWFQTIDPTNLTARAETPKTEEKTFCQSVKDSLAKLNIFNCFWRNQADQDDYVPIINYN